MLTNPRATWARTRGAAKLPRWGLGVLTAVGLLGMGLASVGSVSAHAVVSNTSASSSASVYTALTPYRLLDTRLTNQTMAPNSTLNLTVTGVDTVPSDATAVALNVTVTNTTDSGYLSAYPAGEARPLESNLNWTMGETVPNLVIVPVGANGQVTFYNHTGMTDVVVDLQGYFAPQAAGSVAGLYVPLTPARITDTRTGSGEPNAGDTLSPNGTLTVNVAGQGGVPATGASAVLANITVTNTTDSGYLTAYPTGASRPTASNLNWVAGETVANRVVVPLSSSGQITLYNHTGMTDVIVDVDGYFTAAGFAPSGASTYTPINPVRVLDTRVSGGTLGPNGTYTQQLAGIDGISATATSVVTNVTAANTTASSYFTVYPGGTRPTASDVNWTAGEVVPNLTVATLSSSGSTTVYNHAGSADLIIDAFGYFSPGIMVTASPGSIPANGTSTSTVTATVTRNDGSPEANDPVGLFTSGACGTLAATTGMTNSNGVFTTTYTSSTTVGACQITVEDSFLNETGYANITQTGLANGVTVSFSPAYIAGDGVSTSTLDATVVTEPAGNPVSGDSVTFTLAGNPTAACGTLSSATAKTNSSGVASVTYTASTTAGFCTATATEANTGSTGSNFIDQASNPPALAYFTSLGANPSSVPADGATTSVVTATVYAFPYDTPIPNDEVMFTVSGAGCGTVSPMFATTNSKGEASTTYTAGLKVTSCTVKVQEADGDATDSVSISQTTPPNTVSVSASPMSLPANSASTSKITVTDTSPSGPVNNSAITFTVVGNPTSACGSAPAPATTNSSGVATTSYTVSGTPGFCTITATDAAGNQGTVTVDQTDNPASTGDVVKVTASPTSIAGDGASTSTISATVTSSSGATIQGDEVAFTVSGGSECGTVTAFAATNSTGVATATYTAGSGAGTCTVTAQEAAGAATGSTTVTQTTPINNVAVTFATGTVPADGSTTDKVTATVTTGGTGVNNDKVTFTLAADTTNACGTLSSATATTNSSGVATTTYTASTTPGFCTVTATEAATGGAGTNTIDQTSNPAPSGDTVSFSPGTKSVVGNGTDTATSTVTVKTSGGTAIANDSVMFSVSGGSDCGTVSPAFATTNGSGQASVTYTAGTGNTSSITCTVEAVEANGAASSNTTSTNFVVTQTAPAYTITISAASPMGTGTSETVTVTVTDINGNAVSGDVVSFSCKSASSVCGSFSNSGTATTGTNGQATITYTAGGIGFVTLTAEETDTTQSASVVINQN